MARGPGWQEWSEQGPCEVTQAFTLNEKGRRHPLGRGDARGLLYQACSLCPYVKGNFSCALRQGVTHLES